MFQVISSILAITWIYRKHVVRKDWAKLALDWRHVQGNHQLDLHKKEASVSTWNFNKLLYLCSCKTTVVHKIWNSFHETRCELVASWAGCWRHNHHNHSVQWQWFFHHSEHMNFQNKKPPMVNYAMTLHSVKVGVWCVMSALTNSGTVVSSVTVNLQWYVTFWLHFLNTSPIKRNYVLPLSKTAQQLKLQTIVCTGWSLLVRIISRGLWHIHSTGLNCCSFYLWDILKTQCIVIIPILYIEYIEKSQIKRHRKVAEDLDILGEWAVENGMKINPGKSKATRFMGGRVKNPLGYSLGDQKIQEASSCKYLGIILWSDLNWVDQVKYIVQKAWKALHFIMHVLKTRK